LLGLWLSGECATYLQEAFDATVRGPAESNDSKQSARRKDCHQSPFPPLVNLYPRLESSDAEYVWHVPGSCRGG
jgi:hypothetical protein